MTTKRILPKAEIVKREDITEDLWCIWLKPENAFPFKPGQYITIGVDGIERAYYRATSKCKPFKTLKEFFDYSNKRGNKEPNKKKS